MTVRLVATDLDGTLLRTDGTVSRRSRQAVSRAQDAGIILVMVTGRPVRWMHGLASATGHNGVAICANGAIRYDLATEEVLCVDPIDPSVGLAVVAALRHAIPGVRFAVEHMHQFGREPSWEVRDDPRGARSIIASAEELVDLPASKILARLDEADPDQLVLAVRHAIGDLATATHSSGAGIVEISAAGVTKATGLGRYASGLGIPAEEVVAVGDMPNDLPMLHWAGRAFAVANAHRSVIAMADEVTASNDDDGVALVIEGLLAGGEHRQTPPSAFSGL